MRFESLAQLQAILTENSWQVVTAKLVNVRTTARRPIQREAILLERFKGHTAAVTSLLVTSDAGPALWISDHPNILPWPPKNLVFSLHGPWENLADLAGKLQKWSKTEKFIYCAEQGKEFITSSLDKTVALWNLSVSTPLCPFLHQS